MTHAMPLGRFASFAEDPWLHELDCDWADDHPAPQFVDLRELLFKHLADRLGTERYIDPTATISPLANIGERVIIGPGVAVHEFSTVRDGTVLSQGVHIGYGCEVTRAICLQRAVLAHRVTLTDSIAGRYSHLSLGVTNCSIRLWNPDLLHPTRPIQIKLLDGTTYDTGRPKVGTLFGDRVRCAAYTTAGPGALLGPDTILYPGVHVTSEEIPPAMVLRRPKNPVTQQPRTDLA